MIIKRSLSSSVTFHCLPCKDSLECVFATVTPWKQQVGVSLLRSSAVRLFSVAVGLIVYRIC